MTSANMFALLFLAACPLLLHAQQHQQTPLKEDSHHAVISLTLSADRTYKFESAVDGPRRLSSKAITEIESYGEINSHLQNVLINIPLDAEQTGTLMLDSITSLNAHSEQHLDWMDTLIPGENLPTTHVGVRKGGMISMDAYATRLALETPYISLPDEIFDVLVLATKPTPRQHGGGYDDAIDCSLLDQYPDLVLGLHLEAEDAEEIEDIEDRELVVTPKQYILRTEEGQCILLVQRGGAEIVLGWAAVRGRDVVLDWLNKRTGFGR